MNIKKEIREALREYVSNIETAKIEIATLKLGVVIVFINDKRYGLYGLKEHAFIAVNA